MKLFGRLSIFALSLSVLFLLSGCGEEAAEEASATVSEAPFCAEGPEILTAGPFTTSRGVEVEVELTVSCVDPRTYPRANAEHWIGVPSAAPASTRYDYVEKLTLRIGGQTIKERVGAYADLLSVDGFGIEISESEVGPVVLVSGSGGSVGRWTARLQYEDTFLVERYVTSSNFEDEAFARTVYGQPRYN